MVKNLDFPVFINKENMDFPVSILDYVTNTRPKMEGFMPIWYKTYDVLFRIGLHTKNISSLGAIIPTIIIKEI